MDFRLDFFSVLDDLDLRECFLDLCDLILLLLEDLWAALRFLFDERLWSLAEGEIDALRLVALHEALDCSSS